MKVRALFTMICEVKYISNSKEIRKIGPVRMPGGGTPANFG